jgi:hypothetical protein
MEPDGGARAIILTYSSSRKLRPSNFSIAVLAEAGRSRAQLIETFSITLLLLILTVAPHPKPVVHRVFVSISVIGQLRFCQRLLARWTLSLGYIPPFFPLQTGHRTVYGRVAKNESGTTMGEAILTGQNLVPLLSQ